MFVLVNRLYCTPCALWVCILCTHLVEYCRYYVPAIRNPTVRNCVFCEKKIHSLLFVTFWRMPPPGIPILPWRILPWWGRRRLSVRQASLPPALCTISFLFSDRHFLHFLRNCWFGFRRLSLLGFTGEKSCCVSSMKLSCSRWHSRFAASQSGRSCRSGWDPSAFNERNHFWQYLILSAFVAVRSWFSKAIWS